MRYLVKSKTQPSLAWFQILFPKRLLKTEKNRKQRESLNLTHLILSLIFNVPPEYPRGEVLDSSARKNARNAMKDRVIPLVITGCETISL